MYRHQDLRVTFDVFISWTLTMVGVVGNDGIIFHTLNGGTSWFEQESGTPHILDSVYFTDNTNGWAVGWSGSGGKIIHTTDGGTNWAAQISGTTQWPSKRSFY